MSSGPENKFRKALVAALKKQFGSAVYIQKNHGSAYSAGLVDMEIILGGKVGFYELKASEGSFSPSDVTALQLVTLKAIEAAGGRAHVLHYHPATRTVGLYTVRSLADRDPTPTVWAPLTTLLQDGLALKVLLNL